MSNRNSEIVDTIILEKIDSKAISYNGPTLWGLPYGKGTLIFEDGTIYDGLVDKYRMIGNGTFRHPDGRQYSCHLTNGERDKSHIFGLMVLDMMEIGILD